MKTLMLNSPQELYSEKESVIKALEQQGYSAKGLLINKDSFVVNVLEKN